MLVSLTCRALSEKQGKTCLSVICWCVAHGIQHFTVSVVDTERNDYIISFYPEGKKIVVDSYYVAC